MDMKKFLQAMDGVSTKPVEGSASMARFLRVVKEANLNEGPTSGPEYESQLKALQNLLATETEPWKQNLTKWRINNLQTNGVTSFKIDYSKNAAGVTVPTKVVDSDAWVKTNPNLLKRLPRECQPPMAIHEGVSPHRVALPVQMAMQHYQQHRETPRPRERLIDKYFTEAETAITQRKEEKRAKINQYASIIAERVLMKEAANPAQQAAIAIAKKKKKQGVAESDVPNDPNKLTASMLMGGEYKELDLTPLIAKNNWVGTPKQVINQADKWLSDFLRQRGNMYSNLKIKYKGLTMTSSKIGDVDASDPEFESMAGAGSNAIDTVAKRLTDPKDGMTAKLRAAGDKRREDKLKGRNISRRDTTSKDEWGDLKELSTELLGRYKKAAGADAKAADAEGDFERGNKRFKGINKATNKQFDNDAKKYEGYDGPNDAAQFAKPPPVPQVPPEDGMYGSWEFTTRKDGDRSATHPQLGTFVWDNSGAGGAMRPITWSITSNALPGMSWVTDFVSGTHTLEATGKLASGNLEYQGKMQTKLDGTPVSGSVGLKGYGHDANYTADYANNKTVGTATGHQVKQEGLEQLLALRNKIDEAIKQRLDPKCWKGKHKEGTKIKGGVRVNNCVPNKK
jgi:hypothetical protein